MSEWVDFTYNFPQTLKFPEEVRGLFSFAPSQIRSEITGLMQIVKELEPRQVLEIGTAKGGALFLFARVAAPGATVIGVDLPEMPDGSGVPSWRIPFYQAFATARHKVHLIRQDSHSPVALGKVKTLLKGQQIDFLFIDGDHTYQGVRQDFEMYSPLVRNGGVIAFHDIVPDFKTRYGVETSSYAGEVYKFWRNVKEKYQVSEIISDPNQDGFGIGLLRKNIN